MRTRTAEEQGAAIREVKRKRGAVAEVVRLRAALQQIAQCDGISGSGDRVRCYACVDAHKIATEALTQGE